MTEQDRQTFYEIWIRACEPYGKNSTPTPTGLEFAFSLLSQFEIYEIMRAIKAHMLSPEEGRFAPKPADIVRHIKGDSESVSQMAWSKVLSAIKSVGSYESIIFDDSFIMAAISEMGGWIELNKTTNDELPFTQNQFVKRYRGYLNNPPRSFPNVLVGITQLENEKQNTGKSDPILWGNHEQCLLVYRAGGKQKKQAMALSDYLESVQAENLIDLSEAKLSHIA